jgi:hypothetical protein
MQVICIIQIGTIPIMIFDPSSEFFEEERISKTTIVKVIMLARALNKYM